MRHSRSLPALALVTSLAAAACGSSKSSDVSGASTGDDGGVLEDNACHLHTQFAGDANCIPPPDEAVGFQIHVGPQDYDNPDDIWLMQPTAESTQCYHIYTPNTEPIYYFKQQYRMRPGSHHMIIEAGGDPSAPEGWGDCGNIVGSIGGTQHTIEDFPPNGVVAPEDQGLGRLVQPHTAFDIQLHFYNLTEEPTLREVWANFLYKPESEVTANLGMLGGFGMIGTIDPGATVQREGFCTYEQALPPPGASTERIVALFGHAHAHNTRFAVYKENPTKGTSEVVYDNYDWAEAPTYVYNSLIENPAVDAAKKANGATSGLLELGPGDQLHYTCDIVNDSANTLKFGNEVQTAEMCNLFGSVVGPGFPCFDLSGQ